MTARVQTPPTRFWGNNSNPHFSWKGFEAEPSNLGPQWQQGRTGSREEEEDDSDIDPSRRFSTITVKPMRRDVDEITSTIDEDRYRRPSVLFGGYRCVYSFLLLRRVFVKCGAVMISLHTS